MPATPQRRRTTQAYLLWVFKMSLDLHHVKNSMIVSQWLENEITDYEMSIWLKGWGRQK